MSMISCAVCEQEVTLNRGERATLEDGKYYHERCRLDPNQKQIESEGMSGGRLGRTICFEREQCGIGGYCIDCPWQTADAPLAEEDIRRIVREEIAKSQEPQWKSA